MRAPTVLCLILIVLTIISDDTVRQFDTASHRLGYYLYNNWWTLLAGSDANAFGWLKFNTIELLILALGCTILWRARVDRLSFVVTPDMFLAVAFLVSIAVMFLWGLYRGGEFEPALWQVRPFFHMVALACLLPQIFRSARDLDLVMGVTFGAIVIKAVHTLWIFFVLAHGQFSGWRELVGHEDSVFFVCAISFAAALLAYDATFRRNAWFVAACPILAAALVLNLRRAGYVAFGLSALMLPLALAGGRRRAAFGVLALAIAAALYLLVFWNLTGPLAVPAEKVRSIFASAGSDDYTSNVYRLAENINLWLMVRDHPFGFGFGHPFEIVVPLADLTDVFPNWRYHPHNMIFGLWMALGSVNFFVFVCYFGAAMMSASYAIGNADSPRLKATAFFCLSGLACALLVTNLDQFIWAQRGALFTGVLLGITGALGASRGLPPTSSAVRFPDDE